MIRLHASLVLTALSMVACSASSNEDATGDDPAQWVKQPEFQRMSTIVRGIDYLPFRYKVDGCYARALYMSMELASNKLASNAIFAFAKPASALVVGPIEWDYHVAPLLEVGAGARSLVPMVLDPSLSDRPLTMQAWIARMGHATPGAADYPDTLMVPGSEYGPTEASHEVTWKNKDMPDFDHLPAFRESDIRNACAVMHSYLTLEASQVGVGAKQDKLVRRSVELLGILDQERKLAHDATFSAEDCKAEVL